MMICFRFIFQFGEELFCAASKHGRRQGQRTLDRVFQLAERLLRLDERVELILRAGGVFGLRVGQRNGSTSPACACAWMESSCFCKSSSNVFAVAVFCNAAS